MGSRGYVLVHVVLAFRLSRQIERENAAGEEDALTHADETLDIHRAARQLGVHPQTVRRLARRNEIPAFKVGKVWRFSRDALRRWAETHHRRSRGARVLVVDDEKAVRDLMRRWLTREGYDVRTASGGEQALAQMRMEAPDVVLLDLSMPEMDGPTLLAGIREEYGSLPIIVVTGYADSDLMSAALQYGPLVVLPKPVEGERVVETVRMALGNHRPIRPPANRDREVARRRQGEGDALAAGN